jgi:putative oxidoreductase
MKKLIFYPGKLNTSASLGILFLRVSLSLMMILAHGWPKMMNYSKLTESFHDPFGFGSAFAVSLVIFAEFFASIFVILGLATRLFLIPLIITMLVIIFDVKWGGPFADMEKAALFLAGYLTIFIAGSGRYSLDQLIRK